MNQQTEWDCRRAGIELDAFVRGDLPIAELDRMLAHLAHCGHCAEVASFEAAFRERLRKLDNSTCCPPALRERIHDLLAEPTNDPSSA